MNPTYEKKESISRSDFIGTMMIWLLLSSFLTLFSIMVYQTSFWKDYFYSGNQHIGRSCEYASTINLEAIFPKSLKQQATNPVDLPHHITPILPRKLGPNEFGHVWYRCRVTKLSDTKPGTNVYFGYAYGSVVRILINDQERAYAEEDTKFFVPLTEADMRSNPLVIEIQVSTNFDNLLGFTGRAPIVIASGNKANERIQGIGVVLNQLQHLFHILPILNLSLFLMIAWFRGLRSRLLVAAFCYFFLASTQYLLMVLINFFDLDAEVVSRISVIVGRAAQLSLILFGCELFGLMRRSINPLFLALFALVGLEAIYLSFTENYWAVSTVLSHIQQGLFFASALSLIIYRVMSSKQRSEDRERRRIGMIYIAIISAAMVAGLIDLILFQLFSAELNLLDKVEIAIPLAIGVVVAENLALIERQFRDQKIETEKLERELSLAKEIQDSLSLPPQKAAYGSFRVSTFQRKFGSVAGDWMAVREVGDHEVLALVVDVTGKGVQAALVVHAIQSLWADQLAHRDFDVETWIRRVNLVLFRLGERSPHSATMGVLRLSSQKVTYWCMGHVPAYVIVEDGPKVKAISGRGDILGMSTSLTIDPQQMAIPSEGTIHLLIGSDGVFENGSRTKPRDVLKLVEQIKGSDDDSILNLSQAEDDKTLIYLSRSLPE